MNDKHNESTCALAAGNWLLLLLLFLSFKLESHHTNVSQALRVRAGILDTRHLCHSANIAVCGQHCAQRFHCAASGYERSFEEQWNAIPVAHTLGVAGHSAHVECRLPRLCLWSAMLEGTMWQRKSVRSEHASVDSYRKFFASQSLAVVRSRQ